MQAAVHKPREFTGYHMLAAIVAFFAVVIGVNLTMAWFANSTWSGLVVKNSYVASQSFNADEAAARAQAALGWKVEMTHADGNLSVNFADASAVPLSGLAIAGQLRRPTTASQDLALVFTEGERGVYSTMATLAPGQWEVEIAATGGEKVYRKTFRVTVK